MLNFTYFQLSLRSSFFCGKRNTDKNLFKSISEPSECATNMPKEMVIRKKKARFGKIFFHITFLSNRVFLFFLIIYSLRGSICPLRYVVGIQSFRSCRCKNSVYIICPLTIGTLVLKQLNKSKELGINQYKLCVGSALFLDAIG